MNSNKFTVLISDVNSRKGFDVVSIIKDKLNYPVLLTSAKDNKFQLPLIYGCKIYKLRFDTINNFKEDIISIESHTEGLLVYVPVSEKATRHFMSLLNNAELSERWRYVLPDLTTFNLTSDKWAFQQFCEQNNHPIPKSYTVENFNELYDSFRSVVLKPKSGQGSVGIKYYEKLQDLPKPEDIDWDTNLIQEKIIAKKRVAGAFFLRYKGEISSEYCHQRVRTFPPEGGVTVYSKTVVYPEILDIGKKLLDSLNWEGLAMIEFMFDEPTQTWSIIELNPRLWGSVLLSEFNDSRIMKNYIEASLKGEIIKVNANNTKPVFIRWLIPFELLSLIKGELNIKDFLSFNLKKTCYVNYTYASFYRSFVFLIYFIFNIASFKRFIKKIYS